MQEDRHRYISDEGVTFVVTEMTGTVLGIVIVDLVLGGDNALVIAMASRRLPTRQRRSAVLWGAGGAVGLRILFASVATVLLQIPYLMFAGGLTLLWIAHKLLAPEPHTVHAHESQSVVQAVRIIVAADAVMSLDNALAVAGIAHGNLYWLTFGVLLSVPIIVWGSHWISAIMSRYPLIVYVGAAVLAWTAGGLIARDPLLSDLFKAEQTWIAEVAAVALVTGLALTRRWHRVGR